MNYKEAWSALKSLISNGKGEYVKELKFFKEKGSVLNDEYSYKINSFEDIEKEMELFETRFIDETCEKNDYIEKQKKYEFRGFHFGEIGEYAGLKIEGIDEELDFENIRVWMTTNPSDEVAEVIRRFLKELIEQSDTIDYFTPLWRGLSEIEDDMTLISTTMCFAPAMWT